MTAKVFHSFFQSELHENGSIFVQGKAVGACSRKMHTEREFMLPDAE
jgi:hypothetical protein